MPRQPYGGRKEFLNPEIYDVNARRHERLHEPRILIWNSPRILTVASGDPIYHPSGGQITKIQASVATAPTSAALQLNFYIDGAAVTDSVITFAIGETVSKYRIITRPYFGPESKLQVSVAQTGDAVGPIVLVAEYIQ
jgi:hypothetical protein